MEEVIVTVLRVSQGCADFEAFAADAVEDPVMRENDAASYLRVTGDLQYG
jgi:hypothetical protein